MKTKRIFSFICLVAMFAFVLGFSCFLCTGTAASIVVVEDPPPEEAPAVPEPARTPQPPESAIQVNMPDISTDTAIGGQPANEPVELPNVANVEGDPVGPNVVAEENLVAPADAPDLNV